jgi:hypothetical protein
MSVLDRDGEAPSLTVDVAVAWFDVALRLLEGARGNDRFVKVRSMRPLWTAWREALRLSPESVPPLRLDPQTGLPPWSTWAELSAEQRAGASLTATSHSSPAATPRTTTPIADRLPAPQNDDVTDARARLRRREAAARLLAAAPPLLLEPGRVEVRRILGDRAQVTVILDRIEAAGLLVRVSADLSVGAHGGHSGRRIAVDDEEARANAAFLAVLQRSMGLPAPAIAVQLASCDGDVVVERISRGVVGPLRAGGRGPMPLQLETNDAMLVLSIEELSGEHGDVVDNDVFATDDARALWHALPKDLRRLSLFRDARVVATAEAATRVRAFSTVRQKKTVVTVV